MKMGSCISWKTCVVLFFWSVSLSLQDRDHQDYIPSNFTRTAQRVYEELYLPDMLYHVHMYFDNIYADKLQQGEKIPWAPPADNVFATEYWKRFIRPDSCLGVIGPLGPIGVLSNKGPLYVNDTYQYWVEGTSCSWCGALFEWMKTFYHYGPFSEKGPLGEYGPLTTQAVYNDMYVLNLVPYMANEFSVNLDITGVWGVLGPLSVLGALGPLGVLGPISMRTVTNTTVNGDYTMHGNIIRSLPIPFSDTVSRVYRTYEQYPAAYARDILGADNDCSFFVENVLSKKADEHTYMFTSHSTQTVTVLVVPLLPADASLSDTFGDFDVVVQALQSRSADTKISLYNSTFHPTTASKPNSIPTSSAWVTLASSNLSSSRKLPPSTPLDQLEGYIDYVIVRAFPKQTLRAIVSGKDSVSLPYRLFVTGDGFLEGSVGAEKDADLFNHWNIFFPSEKQFI